MDKIEDNVAVQILNALNNFQCEMVKSMNYIREDIKELKEDVKNLRKDVNENKKEIQKNREIEETHWQENLRRWEENKKLWEENNRRWEENRKKWKEYDINRKKDRKDILDILVRYEQSISISLKDPNATKMSQYI